MYYVRVGILFLLFLLPNAAPGQEVSSADSAGTAKQRLRFGVISLNHPLVMYRQYLPFTDFLTEKLSVKIDLFLARDYESIVRSLVKEQIHFALLAGVSYVTVSEAGSVTPICSVLADDGTPMTRSVFVTREDRDDISSVHDFAGKSFAFGSLDSTSSYLEPLGFFHSQGVSPAAFSSYQNLPTQDAVVRSVLRGNHDGGSVSLGTFKRFSGFGLQEIARTEPYRGFVIVASDRVPVKLQNDLRNLLLTLDYDDADVSRSAARWSPLLQHGFTPASSDDYASIRSLMEELHRLGIYR